MAIEVMFIQCQEWIGMDRNWGWSKLTRPPVGKINTKGTGQSQRLNGGLTCRRWTWFPASLWTWTKFWLPCQILVRFLVKRVITTRYILLNHPKLFWVNLYKSQTNNGHLCPITINHHPKSPYPPWFRTPWWMNCRSGPKWWREWSRRNRAGSGFSGHHGDQDTHVLSGTAIDVYISISMYHFCWHIFILFMKYKPPMHNK